MIMWLVSTLYLLVHLLINNMIFFYRVKRTKRKLSLGKYKGWTLKQKNLAIYVLERVEDHTGRSPAFTQVCAAYGMCFQGRGNLVIGDI